MAQSTVIIVIMAVYLVSMILVGFFFKSRVKKFDDFILGGRGLPWFVIAMTLLAILANAQQTLGIAGIIAVVFIALLVRGVSARELAAFPPLSGPFAFLTNAYFIAAAVGVTALCVVILIFSFTWVKSLKKKK